MTQLPQHCFVGTGKGRENRPEAVTQPWGQRRDSRGTKAVSRVLKERLSKQTKMHEVDWADLRPLYKAGS